MTVAALLHEPDRWNGFAYPRRTNLNQHVKAGEFASLDECQTATRQKLRTLHAERCSDCSMDCDEDDGECESACDSDCDRDPLDLGDYECGKNCRVELDGYVCEETVR